MIAPDRSLAPSPRPWVLTVRARTAVRQIALPEGTVTLGGSRSCGVVLDGADIAGEHARLQLGGQQAVLSILGQAAPALLHGVRVQRAGLASGDSFRLGDVQLTVRRTVQRNGDAAQRVRADAQRPAGAPRPGGAVAPGPRPGVAFLEQLVVWSQRGPSSERATLLAALGREVDAAALCLFAADAGGRLESLASWGDATAGLDAAELARLVRGATAAEGTVVLAAPGAIVVGLGGPAGPLGLLLREADLATETLDRLRIALRLFAHEARREQAGAPRAPRAGGGGLRFPAGVVVGQAPAMRRLYDQVERMAGSQLPTLVLGETGVGKEHVARLVHDSSRRAERPFVTINCAAIPADLLEAELFGIGRGVATGVAERVGKFREAHGGTLFLDEVGELPWALQSKLLRALEEKTVQPVGGAAAAVDLRIVAATNARLEAAAREGAFRLDLYYRLAGLVLEVPPLRERAEDVPLLFEHFLREVVSPPPRIGAAALGALMRHAWTGNVRELRHEAARVGSLVGSGGLVELEDLSPALATAGATAAGADGATVPRTLDEQLARLESGLIRAALATSDGNLSGAARSLGISRTRLYRHLAAARG